MDVTEAGQLIRLMGEQRSAREHYNNFDELRKSDFVINYLFDPETLAATIAKDLNNKTIPNSAYIHVSQLSPELAVLLAWFNVMTLLKFAKKTKPNSNERTPKQVLLKSWLKYNRDRLKEQKPIIEWLKIKGNEDKLGTDRPYNQVVEFKKLYNLVKKTLQEVLKKAKKPLETIVRKNIIDSRAGYYPVVREKLAELLGLTTTK